MRFLERCEKTQPVLEQEEGNRGVLEQTVENTQLDCHAGNWREAVCIWRVHAKSRKGASQENLEDREEEGMIASVVL